MSGSFNEPEKEERLSSGRDVMNPKSFLFNFWGFTIFEIREPEILCGGRHG